MIVTITSNQQPKRIVVSCDKPDVVSASQALPLNVSVSIIRDGINGKSAFEVWLVDNPGGTIEQYNAFNRGENGRDAREIWLDEHPGSTPEDYEQYNQGAKFWGQIVGDVEAQTDLMQRLDAKVNSALIGAALGVTPLGNDIKIPLQYFPDELLGNVRFRGTYNGAIVTSAYASYNGLPLPNAAPANSGIYFICTASFSHIASGTTYSAGDWILSIGNNGFTKVDNSDSVTSVFGRLGNIVALEADYQEFYVRLSQVYNNPSWIGSLSKSKVGLSNVDNTSDANKPVSIAQALAIATAIETRAIKKPFTVLLTDYVMPSSIGLRKVMPWDYNAAVGLYRFEFVGSLSGLNSNNLNFGILGTAVASNVNLTSFAAKATNNGVQTQTTSIYSFASIQIHSSNPTTIARFSITGTFRIVTAGTINPAFGGNLSMGTTTDNGTALFIEPIGSINDTHSADMT